MTTSKFVGLYDVRPYKHPVDRNFIRKTFMEGVYFGNPFYNKIPMQIFMDNYKPVIEALIDSPKNIVQVACVPDHPDDIIGYSVLSADYQVIHWVYVKKKWRKHGVGRSLVPATPISVSHLTELGEKLLKEKFENVIFNPFFQG